MTINHNLITLLQSVDARELSVVQTITSINGDGVALSTILRDEVVQVLVLVEAGLVGSNLHYLTLYIPELSRGSTILHSVDSSQSLSHTLRSVLRTNLVSAGLIATTLTLLDEGEVVTLVKLQSTLVVLDLTANGYRVTHLKVGLCSYRSTVEQFTTVNIEAVCALSVVGNIISGVAILSRNLLGLHHNTSYIYVFAVVEELAISQTSGLLDDSSHVVGILGSTTTSRVNNYGSIIATTNQVPWIVVRLGHILTRGEGKCCDGQCHHAKIYLFHKS